MGDLRDDEWDVVELKVKMYFFQVEDGLTNSSKIRLSQTFSQSSE